MGTVNQQSRYNEPSSNRTITECKWDFNGFAQKRKMSPGKQWAQVKAGGLKQ